jgi:histidyl-tRNA synthetase
MLFMQMLRRRGIACEMELSSRKVKAQMKRADKLGAKTVVIRGDTELENGTFVVKNMKDGTQQELELPELMELL